MSRQTSCLAPASLSRSHESDWPRRPVPLTVRPNRRAAAVRAPPADGDAGCHGAEMPCDPVPLEIAPKIKPGSSISWLGFAAGFAVACQGAELPPPPPALAPLVNAVVPSIARGATGTGGAFCIWTGPWRACKERRAKDSSPPFPPATCMIPSCARPRNAAQAQARHADGFGDRALGLELLDPVPSHRQARRRFSVKLCSPRIMVRSFGMRENNARTKNAIVMIESISMSGSGHARGLRPCASAVGLRPLARHPRSGCS